MASGGLFSAFGDYAGLMNIIKIGGYILLFALFAAIVTGITLFFMIMIKSKKVIELNLVTRKFRQMNGRLRKNREGIRMLWVGKLKKFIPEVQEEDMYLQGKKDVILLVKDNNGLHHTARLPSFDEITKWYDKVYDIDLKDTDEEEFKLIQNELYTIYLMPNPSENEDWLADQAIQANKQFAQAWWQSPTVAVLGTAAICAFMIIITAIITKKM